MPNSLSRWIWMSGLTPFQVGDTTVFPMIATDGSLCAQAIAFVAKDIGDFPPSGNMGATPGLSEDGKFYRLLFSGNRDYSKREVDEMLEAARKALG